MRVKRLPNPLGQGYILDARISVARVRPRTSKGITDLLLPPASPRLKRGVPLRRFSQWYNHSPIYLAGGGLVR